VKIHPLAGVKPIAARQRMQEFGFENKPRKNDELSTAGKNIKIITVDGKVTLRGPVNSDQEQQAIAAAAQSVAGVNSLDNQLEVKGK
jgi:hypothetical protein